MDDEKQKILELLNSKKNVFLGILMMRQGRLSSPVVLELLHESRMSLTACRLVAGYFFEGNWNNYNKIMLKGEHKFRKPSSSDEERLRTQLRLIDAVE